MRSQYGTKMMRYNDRAIRKLIRDNRRFRMKLRAYRDAIDVKELASIIGKLILVGLKLLAKKAQVLGLQVAKSVSYVALKAIHALVEKLKSGAGSAPALAGAIFAKVKDLATSKLPSVIKTVVSKLYALVKELISKIKNEKPLPAA